ERGLRYYQNNQVSELSYNKHNEAWFAQVQGAENYYVEINLSELDQGKIISYCDCPAFDTYNTCKHLVAVLLKISAQKPKQKPTSQMTKSFLDGIVSNPFEKIDVLTDKLPMQVDYILKLEYDEKVWLEWKTGIDH